MKFFRDNNYILKFEKVRLTKTGSRIIDIKNQDLHQTPWLKLTYEVDYNVCVNAGPIKEALNQLDQQIINHTAMILDFTPEEMQEMYRPLLRNCNFYCPIGSATILFDRERNFWDKSQIPSILKVGNWVRFIIKFNKITFKDHQLTVQFEVIQIELS